MVTINPGISQHSYTSTVWLLYLLHGSLGKEKLHKYSINLGIIIRWYIYKKIMHSESFCLRSKRMLNGHLRFAKFSLITESSTVQ